MVYSMYSVRDCKVDFSAPFVSGNDQAAIRSFALAVNSGDSMLSDSPSDFDLYKVAEFDSASGVITSVVPVQWIVSGTSLVGAYRFRRSADLAELDKDGDDDA